MNFTEKQLAICEYLLTIPGRFASPDKIGEELAPKDYSNSPKHWALQTCEALVKQGFLQRSKAGSYRLKRRPYAKARSGK